MAMTAVSKGRHLRDASFSSYLDTVDTDFVRSLAASMHGSSPVFTPSRQSSSPSPSPSPMSKRRPRGPLGELGIFGAEGYFSEKVNNNDRIPSIKSLDKDRVSQNKPRTPSIRSESSFSSKSGSFLARQTSRKKSLGGPWFFAGFQCKGSCNDVKQQPVYTNHLMIKQASSANQRKGFWEDQVVQINSKKQPSHQPRHQIKSADSDSTMLPSFAFPNFKHTQEETPRKSIEVFGLRDKTLHEEGTVDIERNLSMLSWDAIPTTTTSQLARRSSESCRFDDMDSEASSDLFDIAVFPAEMSPATAPYEPSEASIEWSVVTASAAEFSAASEHDEEINKLRAKPKDTKNGGILGCRSDKAVKVVAPSTARMASFPPIPPKRMQTVKPCLNDYQVFSPAKAVALSPFSPSSSSAARASRAIYMY